MSLLILLCYHRAMLCIALQLQRGIYAAAMHWWQLLGNLPIFKSDWQVEWHKAVKQLLALCQLQEPATTIDSADSLTPLGWALVNEKMDLGRQLLTAYRQAAGRKVQLCLLTAYQLRTFWRMWSPQLHQDVSVVGLLHLASMAVSSMTDA